MVSGPTNRPVGRLQKNIKEEDDDEVWPGQEVGVVMDRKWVLLAFMLTMSIKNNVTV